MLSTSSHFSGYRAYQFALDRMGIASKAVFACDNDKYAKQTALANHAVEQWYDDVKDINWKDADYTDLHITSPPCQSFSLAGKRKGTNDERGVLFHHSHQYIYHKRPRFFLIENVKGLLSDDKPHKKYKYGRTFMNWLQLTAKWVNKMDLKVAPIENLFSRSPTLESTGTSIKSMVKAWDFKGIDYNKKNPWQPHPECCDYYVHYFVMNAKHFGVPQNRERVFIVGFREKEDFLNFQQPKQIPLVKKLKDLLEKEVDDKYYLSEKMIKSLLKNVENQKNKGNFYKMDVQAEAEAEVSGTILSRYHKMGTTDTYIATNHLTPDTAPYSKTIRTGGRGSVDRHSWDVIVESESPRQSKIRTKVKENGNIRVYRDDEKKSGVSEFGNIINPENTADTLTTSHVPKILTDKVIQLNPSKESNGNQPYQQNRIYDIAGVSPAILSNLSSGSHAILLERRYDEDELRVYDEGVSPAIAAKERGNRFVVTDKPITEEAATILQRGRGKNEGGEKELCPTITTNSFEQNNFVLKSKVIRRLTPKECGRLMDVPETFIQPCSDTQAYKQFGNSIVVACLVSIFECMGLAEIFKEVPS